MNNDYISLIIDTNDAFAYYSVKTRYQTLRHANNLLALDKLLNTVLA